MMIWVWGTVAAGGLVGWRCLRQIQRTPTAPAYVALGLVAAACWGLPPLSEVGALLATCGLVFFLAALAVIDQSVRHVPDLLTLPFVGLGVLWAIVSGNAPLALIIGATVGVVAFGLTWGPTRNKALVGTGDVLLLSAAGFWVGPNILDVFLVLGLLLPVIFGAAWALTGAWSDQALAPPLALGLIYAWPSSVGP